MKCDYEKQAENWIRNNPQDLGDLIGRPILIEKVLQSKGEILDAGCGEGYLSRKIAPFVKSIEGVDLSPKMIENAKRQANTKNQSFNVGNVTNLPIDDNSKDVYFSSLAFHYLNYDELNKAYLEVKRVLKKEGKFHILIAHPKNLESIAKSPKKTAYLTKKIEFDSKKSKGKYFSMELVGINRKIVQVGIVYQSLEDHKEIINKVGLKLTNIEEIKISKEILEKYSIYEDRKDDYVFALISGINSKE